MNAARRDRASRPARGFTLVEVLVAMVVVALGILALAGLLQAAARWSKMSELRSTAALLADDIADRIRANRAGGALGAGGYDLVDDAFPGPVAASPAACTAAAPCDPAGLAQADLAGWTARVRASLPKGSAQLRLHAAAAPAPAYVDVWVGWADPLTLASRLSPDPSGIGCPARWTSVEPSVRCVHVRVAL